jgi:hypothetical protein
LASSRFKNRTFCRRLIGSVSLSIGQTLAADGRERHGSAGVVVDAESRAGVVAEIEFREVAVQMGLAAMLVDAAHPALED